MKVVREIMTTRVATVGPETKLETIAKAFEKHPFHHIPIVGAEGRVVGIVSDRDLMRACTHGHFHAEKPCSEIMSKVIASIDPEVSIQEAAGRLTKLGVNSLLILEEGKLRGIVTSRDIVRACASRGLA